MPSKPIDAFEENARATVRSIQTEADPEKALRTLMTHLLKVKSDERERVLDAVERAADSDEGSQAAISRLRAET